MVFHNMRSPLKMYYFVSVCQAMAEIFTDFVIMLFFLTNKRQNPLKSPASFGRPIWEKIGHHNGHF